MYCNWNEDIASHYNHGSEGDNITERPLACEPTGHSARAPTEGHFFYVTGPGINLRLFQITEMTSSRTSLVSKVRSVPLLTRGNARQSKVWNETISISHFTYGDGGGGDGGGVMVTMVVVIMINDYSLPELHCFRSLVSVRIS